MNESCPAQLHHEFVQRSCVSYAMSTSTWKSQLNRFFLGACAPKNKSPSMLQCQNTFSPFSCNGICNSTRLPGRSGQLHSERASKVSYSRSHGSHTLPASNMTKHCLLVCTVKPVSAPHSTRYHTPQDTTWPLSWSRYTSTLASRS